MRTLDGSAGDADYGAVGVRYVDYRQPEPRIAARITAALGDAGSVLNVGAGAGSYEPPDRSVTAIEPSASMRQQRPAHLSRAIDGVAEHLPFPDRHFDAAMGTFTIHQWRDLEAGLAEMRRVTRGPIVLLTCDPARVQDFWLNAFAPEVLAAEARRYPAIERLRAVLGRRTDVQPVPIPHDCTDGFNEAYYGRPERLIEPGARQACSAWSFVAPEVASGYVAHLAGAIRDGSWDARFGGLRTAPDYVGSLVLVVSRP